MTGHDDVLRLRISATDKERINAVAKGDHLTASAWVRQQVMLIVEARERAATGCAGLCGYHDDAYGYVSCDKPKGHVGGHACADHVRWAAQDDVP